MELYLQKNAEQQWEQQAVVLQHSDSLLTSVDLEDDKGRDSTLAADLKVVLFAQPPLNSSSARDASVVSHSIN